MKRLEFRTQSGSTCFDRRAAAAIAILQVLFNAGRSGLKTVDLIDRLLAAGVLMKGEKEKAELSNLLNRLQQIRAVGHPAGRGKSHHYIFLTWPAIRPSGLNGR